MRISTYLVRATVVGVCVLIAATVVQDTINTVSAINTSDN